jgi:hypothetical protein
VLTGHFEVQNIGLVLRILTTYSTSGCILHPNKAVILLGYGGFYCYKCIIFCQLLNTDVIPGSGGQAWEHVIENTVSL